MDIDIQVKAERHRNVGLSVAVTNARAGNGVGNASRQVRVRMFTLADGDSTGECALVVQNPVVGNLEIVSPAVDKDAATAL